MTHETDIGRNPDAAVTADSQRVNGAGTDATLLRRIMAKAREAFAGRVEHGNTISLGSDPDASIVANRECLHEVTGHRCGVARLMHEAAKPIPVEAEQSVLGTDPEQTRRVLGHARDHAIGDVVDITD